MRIKLLQGALVKLILLSLPQAHAKQNLGWVVEPTTCVTQDLASQCQMRVRISLVNQERNEYCLYLEQSLQQCWDGKSTLSLELAYLQSASLQLTDGAGKLLLQTQLRAKALNFRRRVRTPWSLF